MLPDWVSNPGPLTYESGALPIALRGPVGVDEVKERLPTIFWLPKLYKQPYKSRFIAYSSSCTTTELSKLQTSCLTTIKGHVIKYYGKVFERSVNFILPCPTILLRIKYWTEMKEFFSKRRFSLYCM